MRLVLYIILIFSFLSSYSQCDDCPSVIEATPSDIATSEFPYYDGKSFNCIDAIGFSLNGILGAIDDKLCRIIDTIAYYDTLRQNVVNVIDSIALEVDTLSDNLNGKIYSVTSVDNSVDILTLNDSTFDLSLNISQLDSVLLGDILLCETDTSVSSFSSAINYIGSVMMPIKNTSPKSPYPIVITSASSGQIKAKITPYVTYMLDTDDCSDIYYYYNIYDTSGVVIPNGSGIWYGGRTYGVESEFTVDADMSSKKTLSLQMKVVRVSCENGRKRPIEVMPVLDFVFNPITPNCGWGTGSGVWNTLSGKWCSE